jgi:hypothetical protein
MFSKITEEARIHELLFSKVKFINKFLPKNCLGYIMGDFSQTHLVTLL